MNISGDCRVAGIIGWPVAHSRSPRLHTYWIEEYGVNGAYVPLSVEPKHLETTLYSLAHCGFVGVNVTIPHKEHVLGIVDEVDATARRIGAVNTIVVKPDKTLIGSNTDAKGFIENLYSNVPDWIASAAPAVLLGAGGAAKAVAVALIDAGVPELKIVNRNEQRAQALRDSLDGNVIVLPWIQRDETLSDAGIVVNATSLGMQGCPSLELDVAQLPSTAVVYDIVYVPLETGLLHRARARNLHVVDGLGMLLYQACNGFASWFGIKPEVTQALRTHMISDLTIHKEE